jgi:hypothetical protein
MFKNITKSVNTNKWQTVCAIAVNQQEEKNSFKRHKKNMKTTSQYKERVKVLTQLNA